MINEVLKNVFYKQNLDLKNLLHVVFETNSAFYEIGTGFVKKIPPIDLKEYILFEYLKKIVDTESKIIDIRVNEEARMYILLSNGSIITKGLEYNFTSEFISIEVVRIYASNTMDSDFMTDFNESNVVEYIPY